jgi:AraC-like DNA-binding protein
MKYIIAIGIFQAFFATLLLLKGRRNSADDLLLSLVACVAVHLSVKAFIYSFVKDEEVLKMMNTFVGFCYLPLLYLYTLKCIEHGFIPASKWFVFIPAVLAFIGYFSTAFILLTASPDAHAVLVWYNTVTLWSMVPMNIMFSIGIIWLAKKNLEDSPERKALIIQIASLFLAMGVFSLFMLAIPSIGFKFNYVARGISYAFLVLICIRVITHKYVQYAVQPADVPAKSNHALFGIDIIKAINNSFVQTPQLSMHTSVMEMNVPAEPKPVPGKRREILSDAQMSRILLKLENAMKFERYFTDSELTLDKLAVYTDQNKYHISETLNHFVHKPFYTFVNEYRITYVTDRLKNVIERGGHINLLELAFEAGFKSKSSFNRYFKEITHHTPTDYLRMTGEKRKIETS